MANQLKPGDAERMRRALERLAERGSVSAPADVITQITELQGIPRSVRAEGVSRFSKRGRAVRQAGVDSAAKAKEAAAELVRLQEALAAAKKAGAAKEAIDAATTAVDTARKAQRVSPASRAAGVGSKVAKGAAYLDLGMGLWDDLTNGGIGNAEQQEMFADLFRAGGAGRWGQRIKDSATRFQADPGVGGGLDVLGSVVSPLPSVYNMGPAALLLAAEKIYGKDNVPEWLEPRGRSSQELKDSEARGIFGGLQAAEYLDKAEQALEQGKDLFLGGGDLTPERRARLEAWVTKTRPRVQQAVQGAATMVAREKGIGGALGAGFSPENFEGTPFSASPMVQNRQTALDAAAARASMQAAQPAGGSAAQPEQPTIFDRPLKAIEELRTALTSRAPHRDALVDKQPGMAAYRGLTGTDPGVALNRWDIEAAAGVGMTREAADRRMDRLLAIQGGQRQGDDLRAIADRAAISKDIESTSREMGDISRGYLTHRNDQMNASLRAQANDRSNMAVNMQMLSKLGAVIEAHPEQQDLQQMWKQVSSELAGRGGL